jgi:hypothetical protein
MLSCGIAARYGAITRETEARGRLLTCLPWVRDRPLLPILPAGSCLLRPKTDKTGLDSIERFANKIADAIPFPRLGGGNWVAIFARTL